MECEVWGAATMIGGLFIYNHKGEVLISRVYRDDIGWVSSSWVENALETASDFKDLIFCVSQNHIIWGQASKQPSRRHNNH